MSDNPPKKELARVLAWLSQKMRCPLCGFQYNLEGVKSLPKNAADDVDVYTNCLECQTSLMFALRFQDGEIYLIGVVTDLTFDDALKFKKKESITTDELIDWHLFWQNFDGNLIQKFQP